MKDILTLADGTTLELESGSSLSSLKVVSADKETMMENWNALTEDNLKEVQIHSEDGTLVAEYTDLLLVSENSIEQEDGTILTVFNIRQKTETELLREKLEVTKLQTEAQMEEIETLSSTVDVILTEVIPGMMME